MEGLINKYLLLSISLIFLSFSTETTAALSLKFNTGISSIAYSENHYTLPAKDVKIAEYLLSTKLGFRLPVLSKYLVLSGEGQYLGPNIIAGATQDITFLNYSSKITFLIPSKPFTIEVAAEYFADSASPSATTFGYSDLSGIRYVAIANLFVPQIALNLNLYYPFTIPTDSSTEYKATLEYFFGMNNKDGDNVLLGSGTVFEFRYVYKKIHNSQLTDPIDIRVTTMTASLGLYF